MSGRKRKLPTVGIFDPNLSQDPQYGNVHNLDDKNKRIHFHYTGQPPSKEHYIRNQIVIPECVIPKISADKIDEVTKISVPIIKKVQIVFGEGQRLERPTEGSLLIGLFEDDKLSVGPFPKLDGSPGTQKINQKFYQEPVFLLNKPIVYSVFENDDTVNVSNLAERGYVLMQNYVNLFVAHRNLDVAKTFSFNVYIDYVVCEMQYKDALVWKADFEKFIDHKFKYRVNVDGNQVTIISRGDLGITHNDDPSQFPDVVHQSKKFFKVTTRDVESAAVSTREAVWGEAMKKYFKD